MLVPQVSTSIDQFLLAFILPISSRVEALVLKEKLKLVWSMVARTAHQIIPNALRASQEEYLISLQTNAYQNQRSQKAKDRIRTEN